MLVNVPLLLKDVVKIPDLDASVNGRGDDLIVGANHKGLYLNNPLEVGRHPLDQVTSFHVPHQQLLSVNKIKYFRLLLYGTKYALSAEREPKESLSLIYFSPDSCHSKLVTLGEDNVGGGVEPLGDVPYTIGELQFLNSLLRHMPEYEPIEDSGAAPLLILEHEH